MTTLEFRALGTAWSIDTERPLDASTMQEITTRIAGFELTWSRFRPDSQVSAVGRTAGRYVFPADAGPLLDFYRQLYDTTSGAVTPLVGRALEHLGYDAHYSLRRRPGRVTVPRWVDVLDVQGRTVTVTEPVLLDIGAAGKGFLVDAVAAILDRAGVVEFLVDAGGDLRHGGCRPCVIALEDPTDPTRALGTVPLFDNAMAGSASQRRRWGPDLHHIVDPATAEPTNTVLAAWAIADSAMLADGLSTALFLTPPETLAQSFDFHWVRILHTGQIEHSRGFPGTFFTD